MVKLLQHCGGDKHVQRWLVQVGSPERTVLEVTDKQGRLQCPEGVD